MHNYPKNECTNDVLKTKKWKPKPGKNPLYCVKFVNSAKLPLCPKLLLQQIKRECYVEHLCSAAYDAYPAFELFPIE